jgi:dipeptidyl aminopeptidase/acylaminoacyl peptidase
MAVEPVAATDGHVPAVVKAPYGTWRSPITAAVVAGQGLRLGAVTVDGDMVYWLEGRPAEGGRHVVVRRGAAGRIEEMTPAGFNARTRVHEYGGGSYLVADGSVYFSNFADQRVYRVNGPGVVPVPVTAPGPWRYADAVIDRSRRRLIAVREDHTRTGHEPANTLVAISLDGEAGAGDVIVSGHDFYSTPRLSPDGTRLAWLAWRHPQMPWDGTELWIAEVQASGSLHRFQRVAGGPSESIYQPGFLPDGALCFASDRDGWWTLYRTHGAGEPASRVVARPPEHAEFGRPQWTFGSATWAAAGPDRLVVSYTRAGRWYLGVVDTTTGVLTDVAPDLEPGEWLAWTGSRAVLVAGSATTPDRVISIELGSGAVETLQTSSTVEISAAAISSPEAIEFTSRRGAPTHALYYPPRNETYRGPDGEPPPLIVMSHGGPTSAAHATLDLKVQFWTSRGFAVADVNYGGSSGFGRDYRQRLVGQWGVVDVEDVSAAAQHLVAAGKADPVRLVIRGGSAGGYTTLAALTFQPGVFTAGASYYGISDVEVLARDTHKFEARYTDSLIGPYPATRDLYHRRSPIHHVDRLAAPLILLQGLDDKVVPPNQSEMMAEALRAKGLPVALLTFEGEQHGFRRAETIVRSLEAELYFYGAVFGFTPADPIEPVVIDNLRGR